MKKISTKKIAYTALMTALVTIATVLLGVSNGETYTNLGDTVIFITAVLLGPIPALIAGGFGSFFADLIVFPLTMWVTLVIKGLEGLICALLCRAVDKMSASKAVKVTLSVFSMLAAGVFMMAGYFLAEAFIYGTLAGAVYALGANAIQAGFSTVFAAVLVYGMKLIAHKVDFKKKRLRADNTEIHIGDVEEKDKNEKDNSISNNK